MTELVKYVNYIFALLTITLNVFKEAVINKVISGTPVEGVDHLINYTFAYWFGWLLMFLAIYCVSRFLGKKCE